MSHSCRCAIRSLLAGRRAPFAKQSQAPNRPATRLARSRRARILNLALLVLALVAAALGSASSTTTAPGPLRLYRVRAAEPAVLVAADAALGERIIAARHAQHDAIRAALDRLVAAGHARTYAFDVRENHFRAELSSAGGDTLLAHPAVAPVELVTSAHLNSEVGGLAATAPPLPTPALLPQAVSSIVFVQVFSPFVWGRTSVSGLRVELTLEDPSGRVKGVPILTFQRAPNNHVKIDRQQLYYETVFVHPTDPARPPVMILPGDRVHVVTSGLDPDTGQAATDDRRITVDDGRAWTRFEQNSVEGTAPPNASVVVTAGPLHLSQYLTPGAGLTYAKVTADGRGAFAAPTFRTTSGTSSSACRQAMMAASPRARSPAETGRII